MSNDFSKLSSGFLGSAFSGEKQGEIVTRDIFIGDEDYVYQAYLPTQINQNAKLPLVIFLHGIRERGTGSYISGMFGAVIKQYLKAILAIVLLPQCRPNGYWTDAKMDASAGHNVWLNALGEKELLPWLLAQKRDSLS